MNKEADQSSHIDEILSSNWSNFLQWKKESSSHQSLVIPEEVGRVFIPKRILEVAENPDQVNVLLNPSNTREGAGLEMILYEHLPYQLTNPEKYSEWLESIKNQKVSGVPSRQEDAPEGIDYKHLGFRDYLAQQKLTFNDKVFIHYYIDALDAYPGLAVTRNYSDRSELQRQGIGSSFYHRLEQVLSSLGFQYLAGDIISSHPDFFSKSRVPLEDLSEEQKQFFPPYFALPPHHYMIKPLLEVKK